IRQFEEVLLNEKDDYIKRITTSYLWTTAITISYLTLHASSHESIWKAHYEKARKYLSEQIKDAELEEELLKISYKFVKKKTIKKVGGTSESMISGITKKVETIQTIISKQNK